MNERNDTAPAGRDEGAAAGPEGAVWLDERAALAIVMRLRPELSREEAEGQLLVFHCYGRTRHEEPPSPDGNGGAAAPLGDRRAPRIHYNDLVRWFVRLPVPAPRPPSVLDTAREGGSPRDLPEPVVGSLTALRHVRRAHPDSTEEERKSLLLDAIRGNRIDFFYPPGAFQIRSSEDGRREYWEPTDYFWTGAMFSEPSVAHAFPPAPTAAPDGTEAVDSPPRSGKSGSRDDREDAPGGLPVGEPPRPKRGRGREPAWDWHAITAEAALAVTATGGMEAEPLVALMRELGRRQNGREPSRTGAQPYAARVLEAWGRHAGNSDRAGNSDKPISGPSGRDKPRRV